MISILQNRAAGYLSAVLGIATVTAILAPFHDQLSNTTVALALLLVVLFVATGWGSWPAFLASLLGMLCFNFFFLPPRLHLHHRRSAKLGRTHRFFHHRTHCRAAFGTGKTARGRG